MKSEFLMVLEWIGRRNLTVLGVGGSLYCLSGYCNYLSGIPFLTAFSPYYALRLHVAARWADSMASSLEYAYLHGEAVFEDGYRKLETALRDGFTRYADPFLKSHPVLGILIFLCLGFSVSIVSAAVCVIAFRKTVYWLTLGGTLPFPGIGLRTKSEGLWRFDPQKKPSEEQLKEMQKNLERIVQRAMALSGLIPKKADFSIRDLALRNRGTEYNCRNAIYVTGPIPGTRFDCAYPIPLSLDQVKEISAYMGQAAWHETLPLELVVLRCRKGMKEWERVSAISALDLSQGYPMKIIEKVMYEYRNSFCWDPRATKMSVGYEYKV
ncbi:MAG: hypothetical protein HPY51_18220 [Candidatus Omnitrophica bacterium]|nr:hypothetical protein [Candidatus Omnitrophota bacterium]